MRGFGRLRVERNSARMARMHNDVEILLVLGERFTGESLAEVISWMCGWRRLSRGSSMRVEWN